VQLRDSLAVFDRRFNQPQAPLLASAAANTLMPLQVDGFTRTDISDCALKSSKMTRCMSTVYKQPNEYNGFIYLTVNQVSENSAEALHSLVTEPGHCGPEISAENNLRSVSNFQYIYIICHSSLIVSTGSLNGVTWTNGDWLLSVSGNSDAIVEFVSRYPY
jgi:hypothetical protein